MKFNEFKLLSEKQLDELRMSPSSLKAFVDSPEAQGILAGFEAELLIPDMGTPGEEETEDEPDYDADRRCESIDDVIEFFENDEYGHGLSRRESNRLRGDLEDLYSDWLISEIDNDFNREGKTLIRDKIESDEWDWDDEISEQLEEMGLNPEEIETALADKNDYYVRARSAADEKLDELAEESFDKQDRIYDEALDEFRDDYDPYYQQFFRDVDLQYMSDVETRFNLDWPIWPSEVISTGPGEYNYYDAKELAADFEKTFGAQTKVGKGYHDVERDDVSWFFEPDPSVQGESNDMPLEIVSPPMPIGKTLSMLTDFFDWANNHGAYSNESTGFHMSVSIPGVGGQQVDFIKLALFLGDEHVLKEFGRLGNSYCKTTIQQIRKRAGDVEKVGNAMKQMRDGLVEMAGQALINLKDYNKFFSINPMEKYIEFRSAGGNYTKNIEKLQNTLMRYAQAMYVASRPDLERKEYYKKLYKLISPAQGDVSLDLFARYSTGLIGKEELKSMWASEVLIKSRNDIISIWQVYNRKTGQIEINNRYRNVLRSKALIHARDSLSPSSNIDDFEQNYELRDVGKPTGLWDLIDSNSLKILATVKAADRIQAGELANEYFPDVTVMIEVAPLDASATKLSPRTALARRIMNPPAKTTSEPVTEDLESEKFSELARKFLPFVKQHLGIDRLPKIKLLNKPLDGTFGKYGDGCIRVVVRGRHPVDVLRTLAHELVHWKQELNDELGHGAGDTGSPQENEANARAGIIMRDFDHTYPELLKNLKK